MREHPTESNSELDAWSTNGELFYRKEDKKPFETAVSAIESQEKSLVVIGDEGVLDHYCRMLIGRLKDNEHFQLEVFLSTSKDGLLKRFNQMLANLSIDEARQPATAEASVHLLVINDAGAVKEQEWALLVRLIRDFPGANVRVALFVDKSSLPEFESRFDKLGRRVHRWTVHAPTLDEVKQLKRIAKLKGYSAEVEKMLLIAGLDEETPREPIIPEPLIREPLIAESAEDDVSQKSAIEEFEEIKSEGANTVKILRPLLLTLCFSASLFLLARQQPEIIDNWGQFWARALSSVEAVLKSAMEETDQQIPTESESELYSKPTSNSLEAVNFSTDSGGPFKITLEFSNPIRNKLKIFTIKEPPSVSVDLQDVVIKLDTRLISVGKKGIKSIAVMSEEHRARLTFNLERMLHYEIQSMGKYVTLTLGSFKPVENDTPSIISEVSLSEFDEENLEEPRDGIVPEPVNVEGATNLSGQRPADMESGITGSDSEEAFDLGLDDAEVFTGTDSKTRSDTEKVLEAAEDSVFLQHIVFSEKSQALDFTKSYEGLQNALIVPIKSGENEFLAVLSGPFSSRDEAEDWAKEFQLPADFWIRNAGLLKKVLVND